jgi:uncharacterized protein involved in propanediol utilization
MQYRPAAAACSRNAERLPRIGWGRSIAQFGEVFQGELDTGDNAPRRCLLSLPCQAMYSHVTFCPDKSGIVSASPSHKKKAERVAELTLEHLNCFGIGGVITIESTVPEAKGCGSSTADCVAAAIAVADSVHEVLSEEELARLVVTAEIASDNFMFHQPVLFAQREGIVLEHYHCPLPMLEVIGIDTAKESQVRTLEFPPAAYSWKQRQSFLTLTSALRRAIRHADIRLLGRVATASASINEVFLPKAGFREVCDIAEHAGAIGIGAAHSGTVLSILFDPMDDSLERRIAQVLKNLDSMGISETVRFQT